MIKRKAYKHQIRLKGMEKVTITIDKRIWKGLVMLKLSENLRTFDEVIRRLIKNDRSRRNIKKNVRK